ncbi:MAG: hypothetical protein AAF197_04390 [Pseudomonadota bacterium]
MADFTEKKFLEEIDKHNAELRKKINAKKRNLDPNPKAIKERRRRVLRERDYEYFVYNYFPHHMWLDDGAEASEFQTFFFKRFPQFVDSFHGIRDWHAAPRGEGKSTLLTKVGPIYVLAHCLLQDANIRAEVGVEDTPKFNDYIIIIGAEAKMPAKLLEVIKTELTSNEALQMDFPELCGMGRLWRIGEIITANGVLIESRGAGGAVRGTFHGESRPKIIFGDDIITDKEAKSEAERDARWDWIESAIDYLGPPDGSLKFACACTFLHNQDPASRAKNTPGHQVHHFKAIVKMPDDMELWQTCEEIMRNEDKVFEREMSAKGILALRKDYPSYQFWLENKAALSKGAVTSWPSVRDLYTLMLARAKNLRAFNKEMQGAPRSDEDLVFYEFQFWVNKLNMWLPYGGCDPSMGKNESADPSSLFVGFWSRELRKFHAEYCARKRRVPSKLTADLIKLQKEYRCVSWGFENNNAYEYMRTGFIDAALLQHVTLPLKALTAILSQIEYIESMEPLITGMDPKILIHSNCTQIIEEMETFPDKEGHHHYDGLVSMYLGWVVASTGAGGIPNVFSAPRPNTQQFTGFGYGG